MNTGTVITPWGLKDRSLPQSPKSPVKKRNVGVPKFLRFLYEILEKEDKSIICWSHKGTAFQIRRPDALSKGILPRYFKHNKVSSFQRQLNYFGFKKWTKTQTVVCTFSHPNFVHHKPDNIKLIKRKERGLNEGGSGLSAPVKHNKITSSSTSSLRAPPPPAYNWSFPSMPIVSTSTLLPQQPYDVFLYDNTTFLDKRPTIHPDTTAYHNIMPMQILSTQIHVGDALGPSPTDCWGDVLSLGTTDPSQQPHNATPSTNTILCSSTTKHTNGDDPASYFDLWEEDCMTESSPIPATNVTVGPYTQAIYGDHGLDMIKHEDDMYHTAGPNMTFDPPSSLSRFYVDASFDSEQSPVTESKRLAAAVMEDLNGPAVGDDDEDLQPKPEQANNSPTRRGGCQIAIGRAWPNGPAIDVDHYEFTAADYVRRKGVVAALRERMRVNSLPGCEHFPTRKRTLRTAAEKYTRCNLYFLPFVKTTLPDAVWDGDLVNVARLLVLRIPPDSRDKDGRLALSIAIQLKHSAIAKFLIDKHAKPDLQDQGTLHGALHM
ncbi:hypothetical protein DYB30_006594 [Aphanomyces astaci]|uniref:HSF-type DNA-binding domain-containing protein n=1 Tax=Aphanomyces astaci TaxID=112090 RepID=A0A397DM80_APHAT|nr:hypothetical protein DYB30_006594 [Aphanomyces astaci]RHY73495.1 hypothetical protein DYB34_010275 [Aphanomyces astaci]RHZ19708.1 hypothetical protein DYB26_004007 [Aphanomyces astaci]